MSVKVILDKPVGHFTNLDFITGRAVLTLATDTPVSSIAVKLEAESRTRLVGQRYPSGERPDKKRSEIEVHKLLYKVATVFPSPEIQEQAVATTYYTLSPGTYEYPFQFKFPFNNDCVNNHLATNVNMGTLRLEVSRDSNEHVKKTLPPSLTGFPGQAEIKYYVKATVVRPQFYKENFRDIADIKFLPIEPPKKGDQDRETYARRQHQFSKTPPAPEKKGLFQKAKPPPVDPPEPPRYCVDVRLPSPAILTCNEPVPLRILVRKVNDSTEMVSLQTLQIELISYTHIRAHDLQTSEAGSSVILSRSNMHFPLGNGGEPVGHEWTLDSDLWNGIPLPSSVAPSFDTCNISRTYKLEVRAGLARGPAGSVKPELMILPLQLPVQVYSGIEPPQALLDAMRVSSEKPKPAQKPSANEAAPPHPPRPSVPAYSPQTAEQQGFEDAPPSYEDAMAESLGPVDGPRREYNPPAVTTSPGWTGTDGKGPVGPSQDDTRLYLSGEPSNTSTTSLGIRNSNAQQNDPSSPGFQGAPPESLAGQSPSDQRPVPRLGEPRPAAPARRVSPFMGVPNRKPVPSSSDSKEPYN